jgi:single-strand selective monofunctional uracil DNA glycosylase
MVKTFLRIDGKVEHPAHEHPKRPVLGFGCSRKEVSGQRVWSWAKERYGTPEAFFSRFFVANYCPLVFMEETGRNRTPDALVASDKARLFAACDAALQRTVEVLKPRLVVGIGKFAEQRARAALAAVNLTIGGALHPSPASPAANRGWAVAFDQQVEALWTRTW